MKIKINNSILIDKIFFNKTNNEKWVKDLLLQYLIKFIFSNKKNR